MKTRIYIDVLFMDKKLKITDNNFYYLWTNKTSLSFRPHSIRYRYLYNSATIGVTSYICPISFKKRVLTNQSKHKNGSSLRPGRRKTDEHSTRWSEITGARPDASGETERLSGRRFRSNELKRTKIKFRTISNVSIRRQTKSSTAKTYLLKTELIN